MRLLHFPLFIGITALTTLTSSYAQPSPVLSGNFSTTNTAPGFEENLGQVADGDGNVCPDVLYRLDTKGGVVVYLNATGIYYQWNKIEPSENETAGLDPFDTQALSDTTPSKISAYRMDVDFLGANPNPIVTARKPNRAYNNYYLGHCRQGILGVKNYREVYYEDLYPDIDLKFYTTTNGDGFKYDFIVHPGGDVNNIRLHYKHAQGITLKADGSLLVTNTLGELHESTPYTYQATAGQTDTITSHYILQQDTLSFDVASYDTAEPLIIDPMLVWARYYGGSGPDIIYDIDIITPNEIYITGNTFNIGLGTVGLDTSYAGSSDGFLTKLDSNGMVIWATYYGGIQHEYFLFVKTDDSGNIYTGGSTLSDSLGYNGHLNTRQGSSDALLVKFNTNGGRIWATYYGGVSGDQATGLSIDNNNIYLSGGTASNTGIALNGHQNTFSGVSDAFLVKFSLSGQRLWATYFGGPSFENDVATQTDAFGNVLLSGSTFSSSGIASNGWQNNNGGGFDAFLAKYNSNGQLLWSTYFGGNGYEMYSNNSLDTRSDIITDTIGNIYLSGSTGSSSGIAFNAYQNVLRGISDGFIAKYAPSGQLLWSTYLGGSNRDEIVAIKIDGNQQLNILGNTSSSSGLATNGFQNNNNGAIDVFLAQFYPQGQPQWISYYGDTSTDIGSGIAMDGIDNIYITGFTHSRGLGYNHAQNTFSGTCLDCVDGFITKLHKCATNTPSIVFLQAPNQVCHYTQNTYQIDTLSGATGYQWTVPSGATIVSGQGTPTITVQFDTTSGEVHVFAQGLCVSADSGVQVNVLPSFPVNLGPDTSFCSNSPFTLDAGGSYQSYSWSTGATAQTTNVNTTGIYWVNAQDINGCINYDTIHVTYNNGNNILQAFVASQIPENCQTGFGSATIAVTSAAYPVNYEWDLTNNGNYNDAYGPYLSQLTAGNYSVRVIDNFNCTQVLPVTIVGSSPITVSATGIASTCDAEATATGGMAPYNFCWHQVTTDTSGATFYQLQYSQIDSSGNSQATGLPTGNYIVVAEDQNGCVDSTAIFPINPNTGPRTYQICYRWLAPTDTAAQNDPTDDEPTETDVIVQDISNSLTTQVSSCQLDAGIAQVSAYEQTCLDARLISDQLNISYPLSYLHYTLYYYDRAGNLTQTIPPKGVDFSTTTRQQPTQHTFRTTYDYNTLGQNTSQKTPDGGATQFLYNALGQLRFSQNAQQQIEGLFSYSKYDELGRVVEAGEAELSGLAFASLDYPNTYLDPVLLSGGQVDVDGTFPQPQQVPLMQRVFSVYNIPTPSGQTYYGQPQRHLRNRISYTYNDDSVFTYYSYDPHGNVEWLAQDIPGLGTNFIHYEYDLLSGKVNQVAYNTQNKDRFYHRYSYDEDNRLTAVYTSSDSVIWDKDASYSYYLHGPISRTELGEDHLQGLDYTYTHHGWLKAINHPHLKDSNYQQVFDPGHDGDSNFFARDIFGMSLGYYDGDFEHANFNQSGANRLTPYHQYTAGDLYNGNIGSWTMALDHGKPNSTDPVESGQITGHAFVYDQLQRIREGAFKGDTTNTAIWKNPNDNFFTNYQYDPNGNLLSLNRDANGTNNAMDRLLYDYTAGTNQLRQVEDTCTSPTNTTKNDLYGIHTYAYDAIGNLIEDPAEGIEQIVWRVDGKVEKIIPTYTTSNQKPSLTFTYDALGYRVVKTVNIKPYNGAGILQDDPQYIKHTYYVRDATGNVMSIYERHDSLTSPGAYKANYTLADQPIYGSDRLGLRQLATDHPAYDMGTVSYTANQAFPALTQAANLPLTIVVSEDVHLLTAGVEQTFTNSWAWLKNTNTVSSTLPTSNSRSFIGQAGKGQVVAENQNGDVLFYASTAIVYRGISEAFLIFDAQHDFMKGSDSLLADPYGKPMLLAKPGNPNQYYVFTRTSGGNLIYHEVDLSLPGNGTPANPLGEVISKNNMLLNSGMVGRNMTVVENHIPGGTSKLYYTEYTAGVSSAQLGTTDIRSFNITTAGISAPISYPTLGSLPTQDKHGDGEMAISKDGLRFAFYSLGLTVLNSSARLAKIKLWELDGNFDLDQSIGHCDVVNGALVNDNSVAFGHESNHLFFSQNSPNTFPKRNIWMCDINQLGGGPTVMIRNVSGQVRRSHQNRLYVSKTGARRKRLRYIEDNGSTPNTGVLSLVDNNNRLSDFKNNGALSTHSYRLYGNAPVSQTEGIATRYVDQKSYELKDHLGNVRAVLADVKTAVIDSTDSTVYVNKAYTRSYYHYYPFGMMLPCEQDTTQSFLATMEEFRREEEAEAFPESYEEANRLIMLLSNHTDSAEAIKVLQLNGAHDEKTGMLKTLTVAEGDSVKMEVYVKYLSPPASENEPGELAPLIPILTQFITHVPVGETFQWISQSKAIPFPWHLLPGSGHLEEEKEANAYLNYELYNADSVMVDSGRQEVTRKAEITRNIKAHEKLALEVVPKEDGYIKIFLSNESERPVNVFFDDYRVQLIAQNCEEDRLYRYGFQSQERDDEIKGPGNSYNYTYRMHDPRLGRFFAVDPLTDKYPFYSPYSFSGNKVIAWGELEGREEYYAADGNYLGQVGSNSKVRVLTESELQFNDEEAKLAIKKVNSKGDDAWLYKDALYFGSKPLSRTLFPGKILKSILVNELGLSKSTTKNVVVTTSSTLGSCDCDGDGHGIDGTGNPTIGVGTLSDKNNIQSILLKEAFHLTDKDNRQRFGHTGSDLLGHQTILGSEAWQNSTKAFKSDFLASSARFLWQYEQAYLNTGDESFKSFADDVKKVYKEHGIEFDFSKMHAKYKFFDVKGANFDADKNDVDVYLDGEKL